MTDRLLLAAALVSTLLAVSCAAGSSLEISAGGIAQQQSYAVDPTLTRKPATETEDEPGSSGSLPVEPPAPADEKADQTRAEDGPDDAGRLSERS